MTETVYPSVPVDTLNRRVQVVGEVWAAWGRSRVAMRRLLSAEIRLLRSGPELLGMVIRCARRHYIFVNDRLPRQAPLIERIVLAHEAVHILRGVEFSECCRPALRLAPAEWATWVQTGIMLIPQRYGQLWTQGHEPAAILSRYGDTEITERMIAWRGIMEVALGNAPGDSGIAKAEADRMLGDCLTALSVASLILHGESVAEYPARIIGIAESLMGHQVSPAA